MFPVRSPFSIEEHVNSADVPAGIIYTDDVLNRGGRNDRNLRTATDKSLELERIVFSALLRVFEYDLQMYPSIDENIQNTRLGFSS